MAAFPNPTRRYKNFRPRQALLGSRTTGTPVNLATVALFNNTLGPHWLVVRDATIVGQASALVNLSYRQGQIWTTSGIVSNMCNLDAQLPGTMGSIDTATVYTAMYAVGLPNGLYFWQHELPLAVVAPGWSLVIQEEVAAQGMTASLVWEAIFPEELDWLFTDFLS
jgi:hypothetical protein